jgi:hypothetical protein
MVPLPIGDKDRPHLNDTRPWRPPSRKSRRGAKTMGGAMEHLRPNQLSAMPEDDWLAPVIGMFNAVCISSVFWILVGLVVYLLP